VRLDVVVAPDCGGCAEARAVAGQIQRRFPDLRVTLIELDGRRPPPERVVATPTYLLDGTVVSLGNPRLSDLVRTIERRAAAPRHGGDPGTGTRPAAPRWRLPWRKRAAEPQ
jgi:hypothetical protein